MKTVLIVGGTRNLGKALVSHYTSERDTTVYVTARYGKPMHHPPNVHWISGVDITDENAGRTIGLHYNHDFPIDIIYIVASSSHSLYVPESLNNLRFNDEMTMYKTTAIGPLFLIQHIVEAGFLADNGKIIFMGSEFGSLVWPINAGNYGLCGSQAALNMTARLLSHDLRPKNIAVGVVHPGQFQLEGETKHRVSPGAVKPEQAASALVRFVEQDFNMEKTGQLWASRGLR
jgi:NAD(P)-dependent dehydrogenase (short-subunit alcohol dehydrogenase family)